MIYRSLRQYPLSHNIIILTLIAVIYYLSGRIGLLFAIPQTYITPIWPPSGVALAAVLIFGYRCAIPIFIGAALINIYELTQITQNPTTSQFLTTSIFTGTGATLQAVINAALVQLFIQKKYIFQDTISIFKFYIIVMFSCLINSNLGVMALILNGLAPASDYFDMWRTWWTGDVTGVFVIAPLLIIWIQLTFPRFTMKQFAEMFLISFTVNITALLIWKYNLHVSVVLIACLIWTAMRFNFHIATAMMLLISAIVILLTTHQLGPFSNEPINDALMYLALFICVLSAINLILCAEFSKRNSGPRQWEKSPRVFLFVSHHIKRVRMRFKR